MKLPMTSASGVYSCVLLFLACVSSVLAPETVDQLDCSVAKSYVAYEGEYEIHLKCSLSKRSDPIKADEMVKNSYCTLRLGASDQEMTVCVDFKNSLVFLTNESRISASATPWRPIVVPILKHFTPTPIRNRCGPDLNRTMTLLYTANENKHTQPVELSLGMNIFIEYYDDLTAVGDMSIFPEKVPSDVNITLFSRPYYGTPSLSFCSDFSEISLLLYKDTPPLSTIYEFWTEEDGIKEMAKCTFKISDGGSRDCPERLFTIKQNGALVLNQKIPNEWPIDTTIFLRVYSEYFEYFITIFHWNAQLNIYQSNQPDLCDPSNGDDLELTCILTVTYPTRSSVSCDGDVTTEYSWTHDNTRYKSLGSKLILQKNDLNPGKYTCNVNFEPSTYCTLLQQDAHGPFHLSLKPGPIERGHECQQKELEDLKNELEKGETSILDALQAVNESLSTDGAEMTSLVPLLADVLEALGERAKNEPIDETTLKKSTELVSTTLDAMTSESSSETDRSKVFLAMEQLSKSALKNNPIGEPIKKKNVEIYQGRENGSAVKYQIGSGNEKDSSSKEVSFQIKRGSTSDLNSTFALVVFTGDSIVGSNVTFEGQDSSDQEKAQKKINSVVMSILIEPSPSLTDTGDILTLNLPAANTTWNSECAFLNDSSMKWSGKGCRLVGSQDGSSTCHCDHLTNFALLISPYRDILTVHSEVLSVISTVGCALSILFLCVCLLAHALLWKYVKSDRTILHVHLSILLVIGYIVFLAGVDKTDNEAVCMTVTILLHYAFLAAFCVMLSEGVEILVTVLFVLNRGSILTYLLVMSYGLPVLVVGITLGATRADGYHGDDFCWLAVDNGVVWSFLGPVALVLVANLVIVVVVARTLLGTAVMRSKEASQRLSSVLKALSVLSPIMGLTWVLGFFSVNQGTLVFQYAFAVLNSLQGCFIFVFHCVLNRQMREGIRTRWKRYRARSMNSTGHSSGPSSRYGARSMDSSEHSSGTTSSSFSLTTDTCLETSDLFGQARRTPKLLSINKTHQM